ncbi:MAG: chemotaxis protein CheR [Legionellales bacterium]|nr:chemotaxis protein CheR [Legionellales bacterium]
MSNQKVDEIEIELLLEGILRVYGYDFRHYARSSLRRRLDSILNDLSLKNYSQLQELVLHDERVFNKFLLRMSITVTEMFRDPDFYQVFINDVIPVLKTYPYLKIWHAGCATGEEVYSMAIILHEAGLLERATIYATDFNNDAIQKAKEGIYSEKEIIEYEKNYIQAGGKSQFSEYYHSKYGAAKLSGFLKKKITFANHNLVTDKVFGEMNVILCRNVMIYFNSELQDTVLKLFRDSLCKLGYLCLGSRETLDFSTVSEDFTRINESLKIYRKARR